MPDSEKRFQGIWNAVPEKRYKHFCWYAADEGCVWLLSNGEGITIIDMDGYINLLVWPSKEYAIAFNDTEMPIQMEIHDFCN